MTAYLGNGQRAETTIAPDGSRTVRTYQSGRLASAATQTASAATLTQTTYAYDSHGRVWSETDLRNGATTYLYNAADQVIRATTPAPAAGQETLVTLYEYDRMGRGTQVVLPGAPLPVPPYYTFNLWTNFSIRNARGELILQYGAGVQAAGFAYDDQGRLERMTNWLVIPYHGRPVDIANGVQVTRWDYDSSRGWLSHKYDPSDWNGASRASGIEHRYDLSGRPSQRIWGRGVTTTYGYIAGELHTIAYSDGLTPNVTLARDSRGRITNAVSALGGTVVDRIGYAYNDAGQLLGEAHPQGVLGDFAVGSGFSAQGRRTTLGLTGNGASYGVTFAPGPGSRLSRVTYGDAITDYEYAPSSALVEKTKHRVGTSEKLVTARAYDAVNRLTNIDNRVLSATHLAAGYEYYPRGQRQRTRVTDLSLEPDRESTWTYDYVANGKLWGVRHSWADGQADRGRWFSYDYKDDGNRINVWAYGGRGPSAVIPNPRNEVDSRYNYGYVAALGVANADASVSANYVPLERHNRAFAGSIQIANQNGPVYTEVKVSAVYTNSQVLHGDPRPVLIPKYFETNGVELAYDWDGNPTRDSLWQYTWDGENRLIRMTTQLPNSALPAKRIEFQYDWQGRRIAKRVYDSAVGGNEVTSLFLYDGWNLIAQANGSKQLTKTFVWGTDLSGTEQGAGGVGGLLMVDDRASGAGLHFVGYEGNGNVALLVHAGYGTVNGQYEYGPYGEPIRGTEYMAKLNPFRFSTKYTDDETGLLYYGYRYYSPKDGRWLSKDPIGEAGGINLYAFCENDPVNVIDRNGLDVFTMPEIVPTTPARPMPFPPGRAIPLPVPGSGSGRGLGGPVGPLPTPGPMGGYYSYNTHPVWQNEEVALMARSTGQEAQNACRRLGLSKPGENQYFYSRTSIGRATGAAAVLWNKHPAGRATVDPPGWRAADTFRRGSVHRGHLIPRVYGGANRLENIVTQEAGFNTGRFREALEYKVDAHLDDPRVCKFVCVLCVPGYRGRGVTGAMDPGKPVSIGFAIAIITANSYEGDTLIQPEIIGNWKNDISPWNAWDTGNIPLN